VTRGYESTNARYVDVNDQSGRNRQRTKRCPVDRAELEQTSGWLYCPTCGLTADELAQVTP
jgi:uncharacterized Zn finger protein (UPF0148 family)